jgi:tight adherence protein B
VTPAVALAFAAAVAGTAGAWELLAASEGTRVSAVLARVVEPVARAGREGREPTAPERRRLAVLAAGALLAAGWLLGGPALAVVAATAGPALAVAVVRARARRYAAVLRRGAPEAARALADALASGHSVRGAVAAAAASVPGPAGQELARAASALALGEPVAEVLERLRRRAAGAAWDTLVAGILLQRDAGGDLAALLRDLAGSLEEAARVEADARAATAQARFTARLVLGLPLAAAALTELAAPGFVASLLAEPLPAALVAAAAILQVLAVLAIRRLAP